MPRSGAYERIARNLRDRLLRGTYTPGARLPSLHDLRTEFGISQAVARSAYQRLISEGLVEGRFGGGYYARSYRPIVRDAVRRLANDPRRAGLAIWDADPGTASRELSVDSISVTTELPPADVALDLAVAATLPAVVRRRRYILDGRLVLLSTSYFPADLAEGTPIAHDDTGPGGVYARLADAGQPPAWFQEDVTARMPTPDESDQLQLPSGSPVVTIRRLAWGSTGRPLEVNEMVGDAGSYILRYRWAAATTPNEPPPSP